MNNANKTHPIILVAGTAVTIASLAATAHFAGLFPASKASEPAPIVASAPVPQPVAAPVAASEPPAAAPAPESVTREASKPAPIHHAPAKKPVAKAEPVHKLAHAAPPPARLPENTDAPPPPVKMAPPICHECGTVEAVREVNTPAEGSGLGAVAGGVVGGLVGNQVGRGKGNNVATILGVLGGAFAGHQVEKQVRAEHDVEIIVHLDDGSTRTITQKAPTYWQNGDRVRLVNGNLSAL